MADEYIVCAVAFGSPKTILPNWILEKRVQDLSKGNKIFSDIEGASPTPLTVRKVVDEAKKTGVKKVMLVAAPPHAWRVKRDIRKLGKMEGVELEIVYDDFLLKFPQDTWFSRESTQRWTSSVWMWWPYEILVRMIPFKLYLRLADKETSRDSRGKSFLK